MSSHKGLKPRRARDRFFHSTRALARAVAYQDRTVCRRHGLTETQGDVLGLLWSQPDMLMSELAEDLLVDRSTATRLVDLLEKKSLVRRRSSPEDRRQQRVSLTSTGEDMWLELEEEWIHLHDRDASTLNRWAAQGALDTLDAVAELERRLSAELFHSAPIAGRRRAKPGTD